MTPAQRRTVRRSGFTLLEVLLASAIAVLLFGSLYVAMEVELKEASAGRDAIDGSSLSRGIINRMTIDLTPSSTPPKPLPQSSSSSTSSSSSGTTSSSGSSSSSSSASSSASATASQAATQATSPIPLQAGVVGDNQTLVIYTTRSTDPLAQLTPDGLPLNPLQGPIPSDLRRISFWLGANGLCRQEVPWFSNDSFYSIDTIVYEQGKTEDDYLIAREVTDLGFEYYDINASSDDTGWDESWDGTQPGADGVTPLGPPTAIRVRLTIKTTDPLGKETTKDYMHVIPIITANGPTPTTTSSGTTSGTTTTGQ